MKNKKDVSKIERLIKLNKIIKRVEISINVIYCIFVYALSSSIIYLLMSGVINETINEKSGTAITTISISFVAFCLLSVKYVEDISDLLNKKAKNEKEYIFKTLTEDQLKEYTEQNK